MKIIKIVKPNMIKIVELNSCPNCGLGSWVRLSRRKYTLWEVECLFCGYCGKRAFTPSGAVKNWNNDRKADK